MISRKYEAIDVVENLAKEVKTQFNKKIKILRTNQGSEHTFAIFKIF